MKTLDKMVGRAVVTLAFGAFVLSFEKLFHVAINSGIHPKLAWIYPLIVEGFTTVSTLAAFLRRGQSGAWYPWAAGLMAFGYSLWANALPESVPGSVVRAVPVICIPLMVHMYVIIKGHADAVETATVQAAVVAATMPPVQPATVATPATPAAPVVKPAPPVTSKAARTFLDQAKHAPSPAARKFWLDKAAEAAGMTPATA
ncbi:DUF2637 domain-containing protein [Asanoa sp. WMMD1127]|uniref:DUF2637 domain-containing protein n=1 Tax=Asanoa sp. WMMD1127 TaxID=3016107 RepID=UPI002415B991|nr:DUF2637 domain-containing protein [Asanoa sp. WMMD1127]MDG4826003.1 DUF2637 domain-containing protein [Asanoa sp. WMMD1127]